ARLTRLDAREITADLLEQVTRICNEPLIYDFLFRRSLHGAPYPLENARQFLDSAVAAWRDRTHFVFLIQRGDDSIVGNVDLMSPHLDAAEIGYWATSRAPGFMTPAIAALCDVARRAGY